MTFEKRHLQHLRHLQHKSCSQKVINKLSDCQKVVKELSNIVKISSKGCTLRSGKEVSQKNMYIFNIHKLFGRCVFAMVLIIVPSFSSRLPVRCIWGEILWQYLPNCLNPSATIRLGSETANNDIRTLLGLDFNTIVITCIDVTTVMVRPTTIRLAARVVMKRVVTTLGS